MKFRDGAVLVNTTGDAKGGWWIVAKKVTVNAEGIITKMDDDYLIKPGELPYDAKPGDGR
jgi:hypothetical protein